MPALRRLEAEFRGHRPLRGWRVLLHMHLTDETAALGACLAAGGASVVYLPSNRNPSPEHVVAEVRSRGAHIAQVAELDDLAMASDDRFLVVEGNGRIFERVHSPGAASPFAARVAAISEHTSGGGRKVDAYYAAVSQRAVDAGGDVAGDIAVDAAGEGVNRIGGFKVPVVAVYRDALKGALETGLGTSQSTMAALLRGFHAPVAGRQVLIVGYGNVGTGLARSLAALGARVMVNDIRDERCLMARLAGHQVVTLAQGLGCAEVCLTTTGASSVINDRVLADCRDGIWLANVSNMPSEIDTEGCRHIASEEPARSLWQTTSGKQFVLLGDGLQVNHVVGTGNPASLMDISFALHALVLRWLAEEPRSVGLLPVPQGIRDQVASLVLES